MKRLIPAIIILIIIVSAFLGSYFYINKVCETAYEGIENCIQEYEEHGTAKADTTWLKNYWTSKEKILSFFVNHESIDDVELALSSAALHSKFENNYMFYDACDTAKMLLHQIIEDTKPSTHSIF